MSKKLSSKSKIHKILVVSLTNIGDVILTFPVMDALMANFPDAKLSIVIGPKAQSMFSDHPHIDKVYVFDKHQHPLKSLAWIGEMRKERFDLVVDLRNTAIPLMLTPRYRTSYRFKKDPSRHMKEKHLDRLKSVYDASLSHVRSNALHISQKDEAYIKDLLTKEANGFQNFVIIAPGAADDAKRWPEARFAELCDWLIKEYGLTVIFVGNEEDHKVSMGIIKRMEQDAVNLCGRTTLSQLAGLYKRCFFTIVNDSAPMHMASYMNIPTLAIFGPTDPSQYGPWSAKSKYFHKNDMCEACANVHSALKHTCMESISLEEVCQSLKIDINCKTIDFA